MVLVLHWKICNSYGLVLCLDKKSIFIYVFKREREESCSRLGTALLNESFCLWVVIIQARTITLQELIKVKSIFSLATRT